MASAVSVPVYDSLFNLYFAIGLTIGLLVLGWFGWTLLRFRARGVQKDSPDAPRAGFVEVDRGHVAWSAFMTVAIAGVLFTLAFGTLGAVSFIETPPEGDVLHVNLTAMQFGWMFDYPEGFRTFNDLYVPAGKPVVLNVTSRDVFHNYAVPDFKIRTDAIPGRVNVLWFEATEPGVARTMCAELCGTGHADMRGTIVAMDPAEYDAWVAKKTGRAPAPETNATGGDGA